jgi:hypothetical protein
MRIGSHDDQTVDAIDGVEKPVFKQEALNQIPMRTSDPEHDLIFEFIRQLNGNETRFSTIYHGDRVVEGVLLTTSPFVWVLAELRSFCHERFLRCDIETRGPHLSVAILGDRNFRRIGELQLFTSQYGDFAGIRFPI